MDDTIVRASKIMVVSIARPFELVYEFLADPRNLAYWVSEPGSRVKQIGARDWLVEIPEVGDRIIRVSPRNEFGVLDYQAFTQGAQPGPATPVRIYPNDDGIDLTLTHFQREGVDDERFASDIVWLQSDLERLKALLESR